MPLIVTFILEGSAPLILSPVYPTPAPASEEVTTEGVKEIKKGRSCPKLDFSISALDKFVNAIGVFSFAFIAFMLTSSRVLFS